MEIQIEDEQGWMDMVQKIRHNLMVRLHDAIIQMMVQKNIQPKSRYRGSQAGKRKKPTITREQENRVIREYLNNAKAADICQKFNISPHTLYVILPKHGILLRSKLAGKELI